jgi:hypothetical protein
MSLKLSMKSGQGNREPCWVITGWHGGQDVADVEFNLTAVVGSAEMTPAGMIPEETTQRR